VTQLENKTVLVVGLSKGGLAACELLHRRGAKVVAVDGADTLAMQRDTAPLRARGVEVQLGNGLPHHRRFDLAVVSPGVPKQYLKELARRQVPVVGEFELGSQHCQCLTVAVSGTNGKTTTVELIERMLRHNFLKTLAAGNMGLPLCAAAERSRELDFLTLEVSAFQLETTRYFRPAIAVLLNITPDHLDRYANMAEYAKAKARLFANQRWFDWAIVQSEALARLRSLQVDIPSRIITFSATNRRADLFLDRTSVVSRLEGWLGPLLNTQHCRLRGRHNAENFMAALAVGRVLRLPLETMVESLKSCPPAPHRCERVADVKGVQFINDSKATNLDALHKALLSVRPGPGGEPNVWLIAGGKDKGFEYHDIGPLLSQRVKGAFLLGETREKIRAAWSLFTPCALVDSLLEAVSEAARNAVAGDVVLLSPACSSFDQFQNYQHRGEVFRQAVDAWAGTKSRGAVQRRRALNENETVQWTMRL
jgi:UDP-N-acetylmuramoylalanine--D-glutamate ligase